MKKTYVKEIFIFILLLILILLILAVALYDFIPTNVNIPEAISYSSDTTTTAIKQEIAYTNGGDTTANTTQTDSELVTSLKSYSVDASDLTMYGQKNLYNSGNSNPFDYAQETNGETTPNTTTNENQKTPATNSPENQNPTTSNGATEKQTNTGTFFESSTSK